MAVSGEGQVEAGDVSPSVGGHREAGVVDDDNLKKRLHSCDQV